MTGRRVESISYHDGQGKCRGVERPRRYDSQVETDTETESEGEAHVPGNDLLLSILEVASPVDGPRDYEVIIRPRVEREMSRVRELVKMLYEVTERRNEWRKQRVVLRTVARDESC